MSFFSDNYLHLRLPVRTDDEPGLRRAQLGAIYAIGAHFTVRSEPALVSLPTGSGKTAVLMITAFLQRATRALVVTPSRLVRNQIAEEFSSLSTLSGIGVYPDSAPRPAVQEVSSRITSNEQWEALREFDVAVATPNSISPFLDDVPTPPDDLFDLLLIDEAHHAPASTWNKLIDSFSEGRKALFTATPFRRDRREIHGRFVFNFPLKEAHRDGIFGAIRFIPVQPDDGEPTDLAVARAAEATLRSDRQDGLDHLLMVRTDTKTRANELKTLYAANTSLRLRLIHSGHSYSHIKSSIRKLRAGELDGIICVDLLGEGFDLPALKIAAIHAPHKSLENTLQFIGRFARVADDSLGEAKFLAVPSDIKIETERLYEEGALWQEIVADLSQSRIEEEQDVREKLDTFEPPSVIEYATEDLSLYSLKPYCHVKIYRTSDPVDIHTDVSLPAPFEVVFRQVSSELSAVVLIAREVQKPRWTDLDVFFAHRYELFLIYYDQPTSLLFINSSRRNESLYEDIAYQYSEVFFGLSLSRINRVLRGIENTRFFNIGMKNRIPTSNTESYRIISGQQADKAVGTTDAQLYHRGHVFGRGDDDQKQVTIGYSSLSKVWSNQNLQLPNAIAWCQALAERIADTTPVLTRSGLDHLSVGREVTSIPNGVIAAEWDTDVYRHPRVVQYRDSDGALVEHQLLDLDLAVDRACSSSDALQVTISGPALGLRVSFRLDRSPRFRLVGDDTQGVIVVRNQEQIPLIQFLNSYPLHFYFADLSRLQGDELFTYDAGRLRPFPADDIEAINWQGANVNIESEFWEQGQPTDDMLSIHEHLERLLNNDEHEVVVYDHRSGEVADFLTFTDEDDAIIIRLYHCKKSGGPSAGNRIADVYDVCGQAVKCVAFLDDPHRLWKKLCHRVRTGSRFIRGNEQRLQELLLSSDKLVRYQVAIVQPGITKSRISDASAHVLAATGEYLRRARSERLIVWASE